VRVVIEFMDRGSLRELIQKNKEEYEQQDEQVLAMIAIQVLSGLSYLHTVARRAHLDIKPENILINKKGETKLTDFGIAREFNNSHEFMKTFIGTFAYMSPERMNVDS